MIQFKYFLLVILLLCASLMFAQNIAVAFKDVTTATKTVVNLEYGGTGYPFPTPATGFDKWLVQFYRTTDSVIDSLDGNGNPTNDDIEVISISNYTQYLSFGPNGALGLAACTIAPVGSVGNTHTGDAIYLRIFNHNLKASATKTLAFFTPYTTTSGATQNVNVLPNYGWGTWTPFKTVQPPNPAVLATPTPSGVTGLGYAGQTLSWTVGTGSAPSDYKVYFGTNTPPTNIVNGVSQTGLTYATGVLLKNQIYYWQIIPHNSAGDATGCPIWSFTTRPETNPLPATAFNPTTGATIYTVSYPYLQNLTWEANQSGQTPTGYKVYIGTDGSGTIAPSNIVNGTIQAHVSVTVTQTHQFSVAAAGTYYWQIVPYYTDPGTRSITYGTPVRARAANTNNSRGDATNCPILSFVSALTITSPTIQASNVNFLPQANQININWTRGNGSNCVVFVREATVGTPGNPTDGTTYTASGNWSAKGTQLGSTGYYCVYNGSNASVTLTNLLPNTAYYAIVYEYNGTGALSKYKTDGATGSVTTLYAAPSIQATSLNFTGIQVSQVTANWTRGNGTNLVVFVREGSIGAPGNPVNGTTYTASTNWNSKGTELGSSGYYCVYNGSGTSVTIINLLSGTGYYAIAYEYNGSGTGSVYRTDGATGMTITLFPAPTINAHSLASINVQPYQVTNTWTRGNGTNCVVFLRESTGGTQNNPLDGTSYIASSNWSSKGTQLGTSGYYCIYNGPGSSVTTTNLLPATTYYAIVCEYNGSGATSAYYQGGLASDSTMTYQSTYTVEITSTPSSVDIYKDGSYTGFSTPHTFTMNWGSNGLYDVQKLGYSFAPDSLQVTNIQSNKSQHFTGTLTHYLVDITSTPAGANIILNQSNTGFVTPHQFAFVPGSGISIDVTKEGYTWSPESLYIESIHSDASQHFTGTLIQYSVEITSNPIGADIFVDGVDSGQNTPYTFWMNYGSSANYSVQMTGYSWSPSSFPVTNIQANTNQLFTGTLLSYTVDVTSTPEGAEIYLRMISRDDDISNIGNGGFTGYTTPHQFTWTHGSSFTYYVQKPGYTWVPENQSVNNINANTTLNFIGTIITYPVSVTSTPSDADIFIDGVDTGLNTPNNVMLDWGSDATITVQKAGYGWTPENATITNIVSGTSVAFQGYLLSYDVYVTSTPPGADIYIDGEFSDYITPHHFSMDFGTNVTFTVDYEGYNWTPESHVLTNLDEDKVYDFAGALKTYTVDITSNPSGAFIYAYAVNRNDRPPVDHYTGFTTPHQFVLTYGSDMVYYVQQPGYTWSPAQFQVSDIQANTGQEFIGTIITYNVEITSDPSDADIFINGIDSGHNSPHTFIMNWGTDAIYTVQKEGYSYAPQSLVVNDITENMSQDFVGTILTYTVDITSNPSGVEILSSGGDIIIGDRNDSRFLYTGFSTPHTFVLEYGTTITYWVEEPGYTWTPEYLAITNIHANTSQHFVGTIITYAVEITSTPSNSDIFVNGQDSGYNTPHTFNMNWGTNATYTVQRAGYTWEPNNFVVNNIRENTAQDFTGTIITYNVEITSTPSDAEIYVGGNYSGFNTPHTFVMDYGTSATYTVQKEGYTYAPNNFVVNNIQANANQQFTGTIITYTVNVTSNPTNAEIYIFGEYSGYNTPHQFILEYGSSASYSVQKHGYTWSPEESWFEGIYENRSIHFVGTIITYTVEILSEPTNANIFVNGLNSGFTSPHTFTMNYNTSATYTVQMPGYSWEPATFVVNNIGEDTRQFFEGTLMTYTVDITSSPTGAHILIGGVDTEYTTPHQFIMTYGTSAVYTVQETGYNFTPLSYVVNNIQANAAKNFVGSLITYSVIITSTPAGADILTDGDDTGFNTPHTFTLTYGYNDNYSVQKAGYTFTPNIFIVNDIQANTSQNFTGTILTYTVDITSSPSDANIFVNGVDTGYNSPHQFTMDYGTSATYTVQKTGYSWTPANFAVNNIVANMSRNFVGIQNTYTINITSTPSNIDVYVGNEDTGLNTPCQLEFPQGANATIKVRNDNYSWSPTSLVITNLQASTSQHFTGTLITYIVNVTSVPEDADIFVNGQDSGFNTPHQFTMDSGTYAVYSVQKAGYIWTPAEYAVNNIHNDNNLTFNGTLLTYTADINSAPNDADIFIDGVDSGFNTPHQFVMNYGSSATYTVQKAGYTWAPANLVVTNITADVAQTFTGTLIPFNVNITSTPTNADIFIDGVDSGFNTPYVFVMDYGTSAVYTVRKFGYVWAPADFVVNNIQANTAQEFTGSPQTYTVDITSNPLNANIFIGGVDTGFDTPHRFTMIHGTSATYTLQLSGYAWTPASYVVTNIQANGSMSFTGIQLILNVTPANLNVNSLSGSASFNVNSNIAWNVSETVSWLTALPLSSVNNGTISVTYDANPTTVARVGTITVSGSGLVRTITVTQAAGQPILTVSPEQQNVAYQAGTTTVSVASNVAWTASETSDWLSITPASGTNNGTINITYNANSSSRRRETWIEVVSIDGALRQLVNVSQAGAPAAITVNPSVQNVSYQAGTTSFAVTANVDWNVSESVSWLSVSPSSGSNNGNFTVTYSANTVSVPRSGQITISGDGASQTVTVTQEAVPAYLTVSPQIQNVSNLPGNASFSILSNTAWTVTESESWLLVAPPTVGSSDGTFRVVYEANPTTSPRTGTITINWGTTTTTVTVIQSSGVGSDDPTLVTVASINVYPNPFATSANIKLDVTNNRNAELAVYSSKGELVRTLGKFAKGSYTITWDGRDKSGKACSNGFYFIRYKSTDLTKTVKVLLMRN